VRALPHRKVVTISDHAYEQFEKLAKKYGLSINHLVSKYIELFNYLASYLDNDVEFLRQNFRQVPTATLFQLALHRLLVCSGDIQELLKYVLRHIELYERGYILQKVLAAEEETGKVTGVIFTFAASGISGSPIDAVTLHIGIHVKLVDKSKCFPTSGVLTASTFIGDKDELGMKFEDTLTRLRNALYDSEVRAGVTRLKKEICEISGVCDVETIVEDYGESIELIMKVLSGDYMGLPSIRRVEELARLITERSGVNIGNRET